MARRSQQRARGEGSVYRDGDGWRWAISLEDGTRARGRAKTRDLAAAAMRKAQRAIDEGEPMPTKPSAVTVGQWVTTFIDTAPELRPRTRQSYRSALRALIAPYLGNEKLVKLTPTRIDQWLVELERDGKGQPSRRLAFAVLRRSYNVAMRRDIIRSNPCERVDPPRLRRRAPSFFTPEEARAIVETAEARWNGARWAVAFALGLRQGEALGLGVEHVDLEAITVTVVRQLQRLPWEHRCSPPCGRSAVRCPDRHGGGLVLSEPKSDAGVRTLAIPPPLVPTLRAHLRARAKQQLRAGTAWRDSGLLFVQDDGRPVSPEQDWADWKELLGQAGVRYRRPYDARHTAATFLAAQGVHPKVASEILGHSQISLTQHIYTHVMDSSRRSAADAIGDVLWDRDRDAPAFPPASLSLIPPLPVTRVAIPVELQRAVLARDGMQCRWCAVPVHVDLAGPPSTRLHFDHVVPWSRGGPDTLENLVISCSYCNLAKSDKDAPPGRYLLPVPAPALGAESGSSTARVTASQDEST